MGELCEETLPSIGTVSHIVLRGALCEHTPRKRLRFATVFTVREYRGCTNWCLQRDGAHAPSANMRNQLFTSVRHYKLC